MINLHTHKAPRPKPIEKAELPPIVRDFYENVRGCTEMLGNISLDYIDNLEKSAIAWAKKHDKELPVHPAEMEAYRKLLTKTLE